MTTDILLEGPESRSKILEGIRKVSKAVGSTIGPQGRTIILSDVYPVKLQNGGVKHERRYGSTKDGVTVCKAIVLPDLQERAGGVMTQDVCGKTVQETGDGTSASAVQFYELCRRLEDELSLGKNPMDLKKGIEIGCNRVVEYIKENSKPLEGDRLRQIAYISSNNDEPLGKVISSAIESVGADGIIIVESGKSNETYFKRTKGTEIMEGFVSPLFCTNPHRMECELENPYIILFEERINTHLSLVPIIKKVLAQDKDAQFLFIAKEYSIEAVSFLINSLPQHRKTEEQLCFVSCAIKTPGVGQVGDDVMNDLAVLFGGRYIMQESGINLNAETPNNYADIEHLGRSGKVVVGLRSTIFSEGAGSQESIAERVASIQAAIEQSEYEEEKEIYRNRIASLTGSIGILYVGGKTEQEITEKLARVDDALRACRAAQAEGYVQGGGTLFLKVQPVLKQLTNSILNPVVVKGVEILAEAIKEPHRQILRNAGIEVPQKPYKDGEGYNAKTFKIENLLDVGIIDPAKVLRTSLENAVSGAGVYLLADGLIINT